jgi:hypothetical protein
VTSPSPHHVGNDSREIIHASRKKKDSPRLHLYLNKLFLLGCKKSDRSLYFCKQKSHRSTFGCDPLKILSKQALSIWTQISHASNNTLTRLVKKGLLDAVTSNLYLEKDLNETFISI